MLLPRIKKPVPAHHLHSTWPVDWQGEQEIGLGCWEMSQARSIRLAKSEELPGESTVEAMGAGSRSPSRRPEGAGTSFRKLPEGGGALRAWREEGKAAARAPQEEEPQAIAGICATARARGFFESEDRKSVV